MTRHFWNGNEVTKAEKIRRLRKSIAASEIALKHMRLDPYEIRMIEDNRDSEAGVLRRLEQED